ncbi:DUF2332 domain-containing protein [Actinomadura sp. 3N508]|uniref:DUF2332 domain-containing protein n=1 Tax=Actinomadura sp. 3N508 TaxID=3375153 RepID=UPI00379FEAFF
MPKPPTARSRSRARARTTGHCAVLYPAIAEAAHRAGADAVGLIDVGCSAGFNLNVDRVGITYSKRDGQPLVSVGDASSPVQMSCSLVSDGPVPARALPEVVARIGVDRDPIDVTDPDEVRWLRTCLPSVPDSDSDSDSVPDRDQPDQIARFDAEVALVAKAPPLLLQGDVLDLLPDAFARVPADALPVVTTTWSLSRYPLETRLRFLHRLDEAATERTVAWVSVEGVGVAPGMPTFGDRRASGHSIIGLALFDHSSLRAEGLGRCWSRGRMLSWLAGS